MDDLQPITVVLPRDLVDYIQAEARRRGVTGADVIQKAIVNDRYLRDQQAGGSSVLLEKDASFRKLAL